MADAPSSICARAFCLLKKGSNLCPVGVLLGDGGLQLCGEEIYHAHILSVKTINELNVQSRPQRSRAAGPSADSEQARNGYHSFVHGDKVVFIEASPEGPIEEIVFGVMRFTYGGQQQRRLITYDATHQQFAATAWTSWRRSATAQTATASFDPDQHEVACASEEQVSAMVDQWTKSPLKASSVSTLLKLAQDGPTSLQEARKASNRENDGAIAQAKGKGEKRRGGSSGSGGT